MPEAAWAVLEGDDKKITVALKRRNKDEIAGQRYLPFGKRNGRFVRSTGFAPLNC